MSVTHLDSHRLAVIADIHGNLPALEAVLDHLAARAPGVPVVNLGDCVSGPLWPAEVAEALMSAGMPTVRGNHDRWVTDLEPGAMGRSDRFAREEMTDGQLTWLRRLPQTLDFTLQGGEGRVRVHALHASPGDDCRYPLDVVRDGRLVEGPAVLAETAFRATEAALILTAHSHLPRLVALAGGRTALNPGSVGMPAYADPDGVPPDFLPHVSEAGAPHARCAIITLVPGSEAPSVEFLAIPYDWEAAARRALSQDQPNWAAWLRTGRAQLG